MKDIYEFLSDYMVATDAWDNLRYDIFQLVEACDVKGCLVPEELPFFGQVTGEIKDKLLKAGFKREIIEDEKELKKLIHVINFEQGRPFKNHTWDLNPPYGFPVGTYKVSNNNLLMWIHSDIEAAILTLESLRIMKGFLVNDDIVLEKAVVNTEAVKVYLRTLEFTINLVRAGEVPGLAISEVKKLEESLKTRDLKKLVMRYIVENIFKNNPKTPKTVGGVWTKIHKNGHILLHKNNKLYVTQTGREKGAEVVIVNGYIEKLQKGEKKYFPDGLKPFVYAKRSLQHFIDELKKGTPEVTQ